MRQLDQLQQMLCPMLPALKNQGRKQILKNDLTFYTPYMDALFDVATFSHFFYLAKKAQPRYTKGASEVARCSLGTLKGSWSLKVRLTETSYGVRSQHEVRNVGWSCFPFGLIGSGRYFTYNKGVFQFLDAGDDENSWSLVHFFRLKITKLTIKYRLPRRVRLLRLPNCQKRWPKTPPWSGSKAILTSPYISQKGFS